MSASLVGSEMCIRDSWGRRAKRGASRVGPCGWVSPTFGGLQALERTVPVSYTHLTLPTICSV
eukprot:9987965-Alexandrium_andersonii.AAC.1